MQEGQDEIFKRPGKRRARASAGIPCRRFRRPVRRVRLLLTATDATELRERAKRRSGRRGGNF